MHNSLLLIRSHNVVFGLELCRLLLLDCQTLIHGGNDLFQIVSVLFDRWQDFLDGSFHQDSSD